MVAALRFRNCETDDLPAVQKLVDELYKTDIGESGLHPRIDPTFQTFRLNPERGRIVAFELENRVVGYAILVFYWSNEFGGDFVEIDEVAVTESERGKGIASRFFEWLDGEYDERAVGWALQVSNRNQGALKLYERLGFSASPNRHMMLMRKEKFHSERNRESR